MSLLPLRSSNSSHPSWRWTRLKIMPLVANKAVKVASNFINLCHSWVTKSTETKVYDVRWHPTHPACFASTDGEGQRTQSEHGCMMAHFNGFQTVSKVSKVSKYVVILSSVMNTCCCTRIYMCYMLYTAQPWASDSTTGCMICPRHDKMSDPTSDGDLGILTCGTWTRTWSPSPGFMEGIGNNIISIYNI